MSIFVKRSKLITVIVCIMIKVKEIAVSRLLKTEVLVLLGDVISILEEFDPVALQLQDVYKILKNQEVKVQFFTQPYTKHLLTAKLDKFRKERLKCASLIAGQVSSLEKSFLPAIQLMAETVSWLSRTYLTYLGQMNQYDIDLQIKLFFMNLGGSTEKVEAFKALGLQPYLEELKKLNEACQDVYKERENDIKERPPTGDRALERETQRMLRMFFEHVNYTQQAYKDIDYTPIISRLNVELTTCSKNIKTRIATNKRKAKKKADAAATKKASAESSTEDKDDATSLDLKPPNGGVDGDNNSKSNKNERREKTKGGEDKKEEEPE